MAAGDVSETAGWLAANW